MRDGYLGILGLSGGDLIEELLFPTVLVLVVLVLSNSVILSTTRLLTFGSNVVSPLYSDLLVELCT